MIVNIYDDKKPWLKNVLFLTKLNKYSQTSTAAVDPQHLKVPVAE